MPSRAFAILSREREDSGLADFVILLRELILGSLVLTVRTTALPAFHLHGWKWTTAVRAAEGKRIVLADNDFPFRFDKHLHARFLPSPLTFGAYFTRFSSIRPCGV